MADLSVAPVGSPEWVAARRRGLGASDIGAAIGASKWMSRYKLWELKTGRAESFEGNASTKWGHRHERHILNDWCEKHAAVLLDTQGTYNLARPGAGPNAAPIWATVDGLVMFRRPGGVATAELVECKYTTSRNKELGEEETDQVPLYWMAQALCQMACTGIWRCNIAVLIDGHESREFIVEWNQKLWSGILAKCDEFWEYVALDRLPPIEWASTDEQLHRYAWLGPNLPEIDVRDTIAADIWEVGQQLKREIKEREATLKCVKEQFLCEIDGHAVARVSDEREVRVIHIPGCHVEFDRADSYQLRDRKVK